MDMDQHLRTLGIGHIAYSLLMIVPAVFVFSILTSIGFLVDDPDAAQILPLVGTLVAALLIILAVPGIIAGIGLLRKKKWGLPVALVAGILNILCVPLGTALGVYSIWIFSKVNEGTPSGDPQPGYTN